MIEKNIIKRISDLLEFAERKISTQDNNAEKLAYQCYINAYKLCISIIKQEFTRGIE